MKAGVSIAWMMISPTGIFAPWPKSRLRHRWFKLRGWKFYDGDGNLA